MTRRQFLARSFAVFVAWLFYPTKFLSARGYLPFEASTFTMAFGSCATQDLTQPIWNVIARFAPNLFCFLGDNIYADTENMDVMRRRYKQLADMQGFAAFRKKIPIVATWDDHDFGVNDGGREYPRKEESKQQFLDFFGEPKNSKRRTQKGIYTSYFFGKEKQRTQLILLDLRWFRSPLLKNDKKEYLPNPDPAATMLGEEQWQWLEEELKKPADFRILGSSIQFASAEHRWERWAAFPREKARLVAMLDRLSVRNLLVISGDMHFGELSQEITPAGFPVYDFTSSGLNYSEPATGLPNSRRLELFDTAPNFGMVTVDWNQSPPSVLMELRDDQGAAQFRRSFTLPYPS